MNRITSHINKTITTTTRTKLENYTTVYRQMSTPTQLCSGLHSAPKILAPQFK